LNFKEANGNLLKHAVFMGPYLESRVISYLSLAHT
jgi:hypothetical protein